ncbi:MAG: dihydrolipoyl dehydrogenase [Planctomycetota bacterium]
MAKPDQSLDLIVIGAGPGGYVAAIKAAQLGLKVACVEKAYLGGTCLNVGCIPSKALLDSSERYASAQHLAVRGITVGDVKLDMTKMMGFKQSVVNKMTGGIGFLFKKNKVTHLEGHGKLVKQGDGVAVDVGGKVYGATNVLIATGSTPVELPGLTFDGKHVLSSTEALELESVPESLLIVGGGYIGVEIGSVWARLGSKVTIVEFADRILPASDEEMAKGLLKHLKKLGIEFHFGHVAKGAKVQKGKVGVVVEPKDGGDSKTFAVDKVMVAVGRKPNTDKLGLDAIGVETDKRGFIEVNDDFSVKNAPKGVYAIGDVIGKIMLAHNAEQEGKTVAEMLAKGTKPHVNYPACPAVVYTHPELASVGMTEAEAVEKFGKDGIKVGKFPLAANGRAVGMGEADGSVKVIGDKKTDRLLGVHILSPHASDMIGEATVAMEFASSLEDVARSYHAHPTLPEAIKEAAMAADKKAIHI